MWSSRPMAHSHSILHRNSRSNRFNFLYQYKSLIPSFIDLASQF
jgi:hypothetical protein